MPSLADTLNKKRSTLMRDQQGQLVETPQEEVQGLAQKAGLPAPPTTPIGVGMLGGNEDQQKMAGTPAQKTAALSMSMEPGQSLQDTMRRQQARSTVNAAEQQQMQKSENLKNLGGLGDRVNDLINTQRQKLAGQQAQLQVSEQIQANGASAIPEDKLPGVKDVLSKLSADPSNMQLQLELNQALGYDIGRQLSAPEIQQMYKDATSSIASSGAESIQNSLTAADLIQQGNFGYTAEQLADLLGVPLEQVATMTVGEINDKVHEQVSNEFTNTAKLEQQAGSVNAGEAERGLARQAAREASATGMRSTEADVQRLEDQIARSETVTFGGKQMPLEQALSDDSISSTITNYLNSAPDSPLRKQLEQSEPQLVDFIRNNEKLLADASQAVGAGATSFQSLQTANQKAVTDILPQGTIPDAVMGKLVPGFGKLSAESLDPSKTPVLAAAANMNPEQKQKYAQDLGKVTGEFPDIADELAGFDAQQIQNLGFGDPAGKWAKYSDDRHRYEKIQNADNITDMMSQIFSEGIPPNFNEDVARNATNSVLGFGGSRSMDIVDADHDGRVDSVEQIRQTLQDRPPTLSSTLNNQQTVTNPRGYQAAREIPEFQIRDLDKLIAGDTRTIQSAIAGSLSKAASDGKLTGTEIEQVYGGESLAKQKPDKLQARLRELTYLEENGQMNAAAKSTVKLVKAKTARLMNDQALGTVFGNDATFISDIYNGHPQKAQQLLNNLTSTMGKAEDMYNPEVKELQSVLQRMLELPSLYKKMSPKRYAQEQSALSSMYSDLQKKTRNAKQAQEDKEEAGPGHGVAKNKGSGKGDSDIGPDSNKQIHKASEGSPGVVISGGMSKVAGEAKKKFGL